MTVSTIPSVQPLLKFFDNNGNPLSNGLLYTYATGTSTLQATYTDSTGNTPNQNPVQLNARGECTIWLDSSLVYKFVLSTTADTNPPTSPIWTQDPIGSFNISQTTGNFSTIVVAGQAQVAYLNVTGNTLPANGLYSPTLNQLGFATNTRASGYIDPNGVLTWLAPAVSGPTAIFPALGADNNNTILLPTAGSAINFARSSDGGLSGFIGSRPGSANLSVYNTSGVGSELALASGSASLYTNGQIQYQVNSAGLSEFYEGTYNVGAAALMIVATVENGSFTGTLTGCTSAPTATIYWRRSGTLVTLNMDSNLTATSNSTTCTITGLPAALQPVKAQRFGVQIEDNSAVQAGFMTITAAGNILILNKGDASAFTNTATTKGCFTFTVTYSLI